MKDEKDNVLVDDSIEELKVETVEQPKEKKSNKDLIIAVVLILLLVSGFLLYNHFQKKNENES